MAVEPYILKYRVGDNAGLHIEEHGTRLDKARTRAKQISKRGEIIRHVEIWKGRKRVTRYLNGSEVTKND